jgi:hypothetical protein
VSMKGNFATLTKESPFYGIFESGNAPITNWIIASQAKLEGSEETEVYMLDVTRCTQHQLEQIVAIISSKFNANRNEVMAELKNRGLPIRASQVQSVWSTIPAFL